MPSVEEIVKNPFDLTIEKLWEDALATMNPGFSQDQIDIMKEMYVYGFAHCQIIMQAILGSDAMEYKKMHALNQMIHDLHRHSKYYLENSKAANRK